ncbi:MAG: peptide-methionine (S)-S-oxide reductase [Rhodobacteraceae bacterium HLUCCA12]|nr:MAG: peptide-methionine (S)-S-oxide reductase [Rhodobacteraceae bacterium HLUCCA12]
MNRSVLALALALGTAATTAAAERIETALVAGGCFWCVEGDFTRVEGVTDVTVGYAGGTTENPTYNEVTGGGTGHLEVAEITYDAEEISYAQILHLFMRSIDPLDDGGQFCDRGESYTTAIFATPGQRPIAEDAIEDASEELGETVVTPVREMARFWPAEDYHQGYPFSSELVLTRFGPLTRRAAYDRYREACGRDDRIRELWGEDAPFVSY